MTALLFTADERHLLAAAAANGGRLPLSYCRGGFVVAAQALVAAGLFTCPPVGGWAAYRLTGAGVAAAGLQGAS